VLVLQQNAGKYYTKVEMRSDPSSCYLSQLFQRNVIITYTPS